MDPGHIPGILIHPSDKVWTAYSITRLGVLAGPDLQLKFQWRHEGVPLPGAILSTLDVQPGAPSQSGVYDVVVMGRGGVGLSLPAVVRFDQPPIIFESPALPVAVAGSNYVISVKAIGAGSLTYQWSRGGSNLPGAMGASLVLGSVTAASEGIYRVRVSDAYSSVESLPLSVSLVYPPGVRFPPESQIVLIGETIRLGVVATGTPPISYLWRRDGVSLRLPSAPSITLPNAQPFHGGIYSVLLSNSVTGRFISPLGRASVVVLSDSDSDGLPDVWELAYSMDPSRPGDQNNDPDNDGRTNLEEFLSGTNPLDPNSYLRIDSLEPAPGLRGQLLLGFNAVSNHSYSVQFNDLLGERWKTWATFPALNTNYKASIPLELNSPTRQRQFRLILPQVIQ